MIHHMSGTRAAAALFAVALLRIADAAAAGCQDLMNFKLSGTQITRAESLDAGSFRLPSDGPADAYSHLPKFCRVEGIIRPTRRSDIHFEVWLPSPWNGKFVGVGNGSWAGSIEHASLIAPLSKGYAVAASDAGHQGDPSDASFAVEREKLIDFGYRAIHAMTAASKAIITEFYGTKAHRSLFSSCSTGGRQALMEAYRYPQDYDGISAMAPANPMVALMAGSVWTGTATARNDAAHITPQKFELLHQAAINACDALDGVRDGVISTPRRCSFAPSALRCTGAETPNCLTDAQVMAMQAIYEGAHNPRTGKPILPGFEPGSEAQLSLVVSGAGPLPAVSSYFRDLLFQNPKWDFRTLDYDKDVAHGLAKHGAIVDVRPEGVGKYLASGRKLLLSHGWADPLIPPMTSVEFYQQLIKGKDPGATSNSRLFMIPGMGHCQGGDGPQVFDVIKAVDEWVETGRAPERIEASNLPGTPPRTRPLCPFPKEAIYAGSGSTDEAKNFQCAAPTRD